MTPGQDDVENDHSAMFANRQQQQSGTTSCNWCGFGPPRRAGLLLQAGWCASTYPCREAGSQEAAATQQCSQGPSPSPPQPMRPTSRARQSSSSRTCIMSSRVLMKRQPRLSRVLTAVRLQVTATPSSTMDRPVSHPVSLHSKVPPVKSTDGIDWYVDSGASSHYCRHREWFTTFEPITGQVVALGDGRRVPLTGRGTISVNVSISDGAHTYGTFQNVQYVPDLTANLLSVAALTACGLTVNFHDKECAIRNQHGKVIGLATKAANKLFHLRVVKGPATALKATGKALAASQPRHDSLQLWHHRLGHVNYATVRQLFAEQMAADVASLSATRPCMPPAPGDPTPHCDARAGQVPSPTLSSSVLNERHCPPAAPPHGPLRTFPHPLSGGALLHGHH